MTHEDHADALVEEYLSCPPRGSNYIPLRKRIAATRRQAVDEALGEIEAVLLLYDTRTTLDEIRRRREELAR